jgi:hypothetical protein
MQNHGHIHPRSCALSIDTVTPAGFDAFLDLVEKRVA